MYDSRASLDLVRSGGRRLKESAAYPRAFGEFVVSQFEAG